MSPRHILSLGNFFSAAHFFLVIYIVAPYLAQIVGEAAAGLVIAGGAFLALATFPLMARLVHRHGAKKLALYLAGAQAVLLTILAGNPAPVIAIVSVALVWAISPIISYQLDLLLEATVAEESTTGRIRTAFLTAGNLALVLSPIIVGFLLDSTERYDYVFFAAAVSLTPFIMLFLVERLPEGAPPCNERLAAALTCFLHDRDLRAVALGHGVLQLFYNFAPLYIPLYLHNVLKMPWDQLSWMFAIALLPFLFIEYPAGWLADRYLGDRRLFLIGFLIMGVSFSLLAFVNAATPVLVILVILILTRVGAALAEAMSEGHFFRRITERDASTITAFRMLRPAASIIAPIVGSILLVFGSYSMLFALTGIAIALLGASAARAMHEAIKVNGIPFLASQPSPQTQVSEG